MLADQPLSFIGTQRSCSCICKSKGDLIGFQQRWDLSFSAEAMNAISRIKDYIPFYIVSAREILDKIFDPIDSADSISCASKTGTYSITRGGIMIEVDMMSCWVSRC